MISDENIKLAIMRAAKNKRKNNKRHRKLRQIRNEMDKYIPIVRGWIIEYLDRDIQHKPTEINDGISAKKRTIIVPCVAEMLVHHAIVNVLKPILTQGMYEHSYASIPGRGLHAGVKITRKWIARNNRHTKYFLKLDIRKFFDSIDQDVLLAKLQKKIRDKQFFKYIEKVVRTTKSGIPLGFTTSQWFANFLLTELDHLIKEDWGVKHYIRFMDDMVLFGSNKRELHRIKDKIEKYLNQVLHLQLKGNWQVVFLDSTKSRKKKGHFLDFLGFKFYRNHVGLRGKIALKAQRKAKRISKKPRANVMDARQMIAYAGFMKYADCYDWFHDHISPYVSIKQMREIVSRYDSRQATKQTKKKKEKHKTNNDNKGVIVNECVV